MAFDPFAYARPAAHAAQSFPHLPEPTAEEVRYALESVRAPGYGCATDDPFAYARPVPRPRVPLTIAQVQAAGGYSVILADCPWSYDDQNCNGAAEQQYRCMTFNDLCSLPVQYIAAPNCALFLWATYPKITDALNLMPFWGFQYKSYAFDWIKLRGGRPQMGLGRWTRGASEVCLLATRGKPQRQDKGVRQLVETLVAEGSEDERILYSPATRHSQKPPEIRERIVQLLGDVPRLEMFARDRAVGWDCYGNEVPGGSDVIL
jgi:N6-adenosine-specific RNA methylase IME4